MRSSDDVPFRGGGKNIMPQKHGFTPRTVLGARFLKEWKHPLHRRVFLVVKSVKVVLCKPYFYRKTMPLASIVFEAYYKRDDH